MSSLRTKKNSISKSQKDSHQLRRKVLNKLFWIKKNNKRGMIRREKENSKERWRRRHLRKLFRRLKRRRRRSKRWRRGRKLRRKGLRRRDSSSRLFWWMRDFRRLRWKSISRWSHIQLFWIKMIMLWSWELIKVVVVLKVLIKNIVWKSREILKW